MNKQRVYRAGHMTPSADCGPAKAVTEQADAQCPHPTPRMGALFASPTMPGVVRWVLGNDMCRYETRVREITVDADTTYVYYIHAWESVSWNMRGFEDDKADAYWRTGLTLTEWLSKQDMMNFDASDWEVLIDPAAVLSVRNVSAARFMKAAPEWRIPELKRVVRSWARAA